MAFPKLRKRVSLRLVDQIYRSLINRYRISGSENTNIADNRYIIPATTITKGRNVCHKGNKADFPLSAFKRANRVLRNLFLNNVRFCFPVYPNGAYWAGHCTFTASNALSGEIFALSSTTIA